MRYDKFQAPNTKSIGVSKGTSFLLFKYKGAKSLFGLLLLPLYLPFITKWHNGSKQKVQGILLSFFQKQTFSDTGYFAPGAGVFLFCVLALPGEYRCFCFLFMARYTRRLLVTARCSYLKARCPRGAI